MKTHDDARDALRLRRSELLDVGGVDDDQSLAMTDDKCNAKDERCGLEYKIMM